MPPNRINLITLNNNYEPFIKASELAKRLGYEETDQVSRIIRRKKDDFIKNEHFIISEKTMYLNYEAAIKVCMLATTSCSSRVREEVTQVYKSWRNGEIYTQKEMTKAEKAFHLAKAVMSLAESQLELEQRQDQTEQKLEQVEVRVEQLSKKLSPKVFITDEQASEISALVRMAGHAITGKGKNGYQTVYGELYRRFSITNYKNIPQDKFPEVIRWLKDYCSSLLNQNKMLKSQ